MMMVCQKSEYKRSLLYAVLLHLGIFIVFAISFDFTQPNLNSGARPSEPIQAVTVDQTKVQAEVAHIKAQEVAKQKAEIAHERHLKQLAAQAKAQQRKAALHLKRLKKQQEQLRHEHIQQEKAAQQKLAQIRKQQTLEQQRLTKLQQERAKQSTQTHQALPQSHEEKMLAQQLESEQQRLTAMQNQRFLSEINRQKALILNAIGQRWIMPAHVDKNLSTQLLIQLNTPGTVLQVTLIKSSGDRLLDQSVINAIHKASPLPMPVDPALLEKFKELRLTVRPEGLLGH